MSTKTKVQWKIVTAILLATGMTTTAYAVERGLYLGLMGGPATNSAGDQQAQVLNQPYNVTVTAKPRSKQFGNRAYIGYQLNRYAGFEGGFTFFSGIHYDTGDVETCGGASTRVRDIDIVAKGILPFRDTFDVFAKGGVAATYLTSSGAFNPSPKLSCGKNTYENKFSPTFSIGSSYYINQSWVLDASYNTLLVGGNAGNMSMFALGVSYHFVDVYCGQFLC